MGLKTRKSNYITQALLILTNVEHSAEGYVTLFYRPFEMCDNL